MNDNSQNKSEKKNSKCDKISLEVKWSLKAKIYGKFRILEL